ncbi:MAG: hypothetical protein ACTHMS_13185 [Jatrophihabitans sp.]
MSGQPDPYQCQHCGAFWPVRVLARDCERKHNAASTETRTTNIERGA